MSFALARLTKLREAARGRDCQARLIGICNHNPETVVLAHFRMIGITGMGYKSGSDWLGAWLCSSCHTEVDRNKSPEIQLDFAKAVFRTQAQLIEEARLEE